MMRDELCEQIDSPESSMVNRASCRRFASISEDNVSTSCFPEPGRAGCDGMHPHFGVAYERLKSIAHRELGRSGDRNSDTTALVHDLYVKVATGREREFSDSDELVHYAARVMRHILIDRARYRVRLKGGGRDQHLPLDHAAAGASSPDPLLALHLDAALTALEMQDARAARVVELHYFAGLTLDRVAAKLGVVRRTVDRDWRYARAFLLAQIE